MTDIADTVAELATLWPALAAALARDSADGPPAAPTWLPASLVNADVEAAIHTLDHDVPAAIRTACADISETWRWRDLDGCLRQVPRLAGRMRDLGHVGAERTLGWQAARWLRMVKRALGLQRPDTPLPGGPACPDADIYPERHRGADRLFLAGAEGFLRPGRLVPVEWVTSGLIYCESADCGASWSQLHWDHLGRLLARARAESRDAAA